MQIQNVQDFFPCGYMIYMITQELKDCIPCRYMICRTWHSSHAETQHTVLFACGISSHLGGWYLVLPMCIHDIKDCFLVGTLYSEYLSMHKYDIQDGFPCRFMGTRTSFPCGYNISSTLSHTCSKCLRLLPMPVFDVVNYCPCRYMISRTAPHACT